MSTEPPLIAVPEELLTERLRLRCPREADGEMINAAVAESIEKVARWMPWANPTPTVEQTTQWCRQSHAKFVAREEFHFLIFRESDEMYLGTCGFHHVRWKVPIMEIGYWLRTKFEGQGYMTEAVSALTKFAFETLKAARVEIHTDETNEPSFKVAERCGYKLDGIFKHDTRGIDGTLRNTRIYSKLAPP